MNAARCPLVLVSALLLLISCAQCAPFSSWAGKRSAGSYTRADLVRIMKELRDLSELEAEMGEDSAIYPVMEVNKRAPFSSWAGKRAPFSSWAGKRAPFSSWAGKRSGESSSDESNHRFKRSSDEYESVEEEHDRVRRGANSFSAWGGKRSGQGQALRRFTRNAPALEAGNVRVLRPARAAFSAWGGRK